MGLYNFMPQFEEPIMSGRKRHTIRGDRKFPDKPGNILHLYVGLRHPGARCLMRPPCTKVQIILLAVDDMCRAQVYIEENRLAEDERELLAIADGFDHWRQMADFWNGRYPFKGNIIHWNPEGLIK